MEKMAQRVLEELLSVKPGTLTPGHLRGRIIDDYPYGSDEPSRENILKVLNQLEETGEVEMVSLGRHEVVSEWRAT